jgi:hypothetical protein
MSYHGPGLGLPAITPTTAFAQAVDPYATRFSPPGAIYAPYGWGPDFMVGMPMNYTHHIGYERTPIPGARRVGPMYDVVGPYLGDAGIFSPSGGPYEGNAQSLGLSGMLAVM